MTTIVKDARKIESSGNEYLYVSISLLSVERFITPDVRQPPKADKSAKFL